MTKINASLTLFCLLVAGVAHAQEGARALESRLRAAEARMHDMRSDLGLDALHSFKARSSRADHLGRTHTRVDQYYNGRRVIGGDSILHERADRAASMEMTKAFHKGISLATDPAIAQEEALALVDQDMAIKGQYAYAPAVELVVLPVSESIPRKGFQHLRAESLNATDMETRVTGYHLAYQIIVATENQEDGFQEMLYMVDAFDGKILQKRSNLRTTASKGSGKSHFSGTVTLDTNSITNGYELRDMTRGSGGNATYDLAHVNGETSSSKGTLYTDADNAWGDGANYSSSSSTTSANGQTAAVDAHYGVQVTWDMFKNVYGRNGIDGNGKATYNRVHAGNNYVNAFWSDGCFCMTFGDGGSGYKALTALDVVAHEFSHGVCSKAAGLIYQGESGGLNEANSDIFGSMAEFYSAGGGYAARATAIPDSGGDYLIGEDMSSVPLRYMHKPSKDGQSPDAWSSTIGNLDVHYSSGPMNRCFYFMAKGAATSGESSAPTYLPSGMSGIGNDKASKIWYRALDVYFTSSTNYAGAREACIKAAKDLYGAGSAEEAAVWNAFCGINVGKAWSGTSTSSGVSITPSSLSLKPGASYQFQAVVTGLSSTEVKWSATGGAISASGLYTAPSSAGSYKVRATAAADSTKFAECSVNVSDVSASGNLIQNGGFESGSAPWTGSIAKIGAWAQQPAFEGTRNAWLGGKGARLTETLSQKVSIPANAAQAIFSFQLHIDSKETTRYVAYDKLTLVVQSETGSQLATLARYTNLDARTGYVQKSFDLSAYKGKTLQLTFKMVEDQVNQTSFVLDNVQLMVK